MPDRNTDFYQKIAKRAIVLFLIIFCGLTVSAQESLSYNRAAWHSSSVDYDHTAHLATDGDLATSWISKPGDHEWIYIDLGNKCKISGIKIYWGSHFAETFEILVSESGGPNNPLNWKKISNGKAESGSVQTLKVNSSARYIKLQCTKSSSGQGMAIREFEITGSGRILKSPATLPDAGNERMLSLSDNQWETQRSSFVTAKGEEISGTDFTDSNWLPASVPATVLANYIAAGAVPDPLYGDNQLQVSDWFFTSNFWYRRVFTVPENFKNKKIRLYFKGINWKADVYVNGTFIGIINGAFTRADFDITKLVKPGSKCAVAVLIHKNDNPGEVTEQHLCDPDGNGGIIGLDSPTYMAGIGWNWVPTIRGRNTGITDDVYLSASGEVTFANPLITTKLNLPDTSKADFEVAVDVKNNSNISVTGSLRISCTYFTIEIPVSLSPNESKMVKADKSAFEKMSVYNPKLWWPNG
ncbi:MAG: glycosyl hydrolase 2 galactose-binding domain-containing protein, partial [Bacteroidales bacterium]